MESMLFQITIYLAAAVIAVPVAARLGLGSVLGYLLAGVLIGPVLGFAGSETQDLQHIAEFGVVMMLFLIGLELDPKALWAMRHRLIGLGGMQVILTTLLIMWAAMAMGQAWAVGFAIGLSLSLSSTAIVLQTLSEKGLMQTAGGRSAFSVLLAQDIAVIPMLAFLPLLAISGIYNLVAYQASLAEHATEEGVAETAVTFVESLPAWGVTLVTIGAIGVITLAGIYLISPIFRFIHHTRMREMYTALALLIVISIAFLMTLVGLSPALGTFLAGVLLANSEFRHELQSDIEPFKGLLLGLFFITVGAGIDFRALWTHFGDVIVLTLLLMMLKGAVLFVIAHVYGLRKRDKWLFTLGLAQAGEFGFVLLSFSLQQNVIPALLYEKLQLIVALSMLLTPLFFILYERLSNRTDEGGKHPDADEIDEHGTVIVAGIGRFGQVVNRLVQSSGFRTTVLDHDMDVITTMRRFGVKSFFGDPSRPELLHAAGLEEAAVLVVAIDDIEASTKLVRYARRTCPDLPIIARAFDREHVYNLYSAGATDIVREMFDSSLRAGRYVLEHLALSEYEAAESERLFYKHDRLAVRELAELWDPNIPAGENEAYANRAREMDKDLEAALMHHLTAREAEDVTKSGDADGAATETETGPHDN